MRESLAPLFYKAVFLFLICKSSLDIVDVSSLSDVPVTNTSSATQLRLRICVSPLKLCTRWPTQDLSNVWWTCQALYGKDGFLISGLSSHLTSFPETSSKSEVGTIIGPVAGPILLNSTLPLWKKNCIQKVHKNSRRGLTNKVNIHVTTIQAKKEHCQHSKVSCKSLK